MKVAVFGLGYVGTVTAAVLASNGHHVVGVDVDPGKVGTVNSGCSPVVEPGLHDLVGRAVADGTLRATCDLGEALAESSISLVCVGTPSSPQGGTDLRFVRRAVADIAEALAARSATDKAARRHTLVIRSTVPPGTVDEHLIPMLGQRLEDSGITVGVGVCPEFLREGTAIADFYDGPICVVGTDDVAVGETVTELFGFLRSPVTVVEPRTAEGLKFACNAFHATKISFANEIGRLFRTLGVNSRAVMELFCSDTKLNISSAYLRPGFAFGGSCLPKDLRSLLHLGRMQSLDLPLLGGAMATNTLCVSDVVNRIVASDARSVAILGLSFKMGSDDLRESPFVDVAETLIGKGFDVRIFDSTVQSSTLVGANQQYIDAKLPHLSRLLARQPLEALDGADVVVVSSSDPQIREALSLVQPRMIIDLCGSLGADIEALAGYQGVAW
jgi:GDP-mannose 6-dehydrogenase